MATDRAVLYLDLDAFFASVEMLENPELTGKPLLIGGSRKRGVVASASYEAREFGVHSAMPMRRALEKCPDAVVLPTRHELYREYSGRVMERVQAVGDRMDVIGIDEACVEVTDGIDRWDEAAQIAGRLQAAISEELELPSSFGVATNRLVAKIASDQDKPRGLTVVPPGREAAFLAPLPVSELRGVGPKTEVSLHELGLQTIGDLAELSADRLERRFGKHGRAMYRRARGLDERPVGMPRTRKSVSKERTFSDDLDEPRALAVRLWTLSQKVGARLRSKQLVGGTVAIKLRYADFTTITRQRSLARPTDEDERIYRIALELLKRAWERDRPVRLLGVGTHDLTPPTGQLTLPFEEADASSDSSARQGTSPGVPEN